jgi:hypothetical protein
MEPRMKHGRNTDSKAKPGRISFGGPACGSIFSFGVSSVFHPWLVKAFF